MSKTLEDMYTDHRGILMIVSGPAGAGKGSSVKWLADRDPNIFLSVSETTRAPRKGDEEGVTYYFIDHETFKKRIDEGHYFEWAKIYDNYYGTPKEHILKRLENGEDVILEIEMQGAQKVKEQYPQAVTVFIMPPSLEELRDRITGRGADSAQEIEKRMNCTQEEIRLARDYDYIIVNKNEQLARTGELLRDIFTAEHLKTSNILHSENPA